MVTIFVQFLLSIRLKTNELVKMQTKLSQENLAIFYKFLLRVASFRCQILFTGRHADEGRDAG